MTLKIKVANFKELLCGATIIVHLEPCVVVILGFLLLFFLALLEKGCLATPTFIYEKNTRVSKSLIIVGTQNFLKVYKSGLSVYLSELLKIKKKKTLTMFHKV